MEDNKGKFASLEEMVISTRTRTATTYSKDDLETYLNNPYRYHTKLREVSDYFYYTNGIYKNIINAFCNLATLDSIILPSSKTVEKMTDKSYLTYFDKVNSYCDSVNVKLATRIILKSIARYGGYVGYERSDGSEYTIQSLPLDYCRIKNKIGHDFVVEFNFKYFDKFFNKDDLELAWLAYPLEFKKLYNKYKADKKSRYPEWQMLDIKKTFVILVDDDEPMFIPYFSGMFEALLNNEEFKELIKIGQEMDISKLIVQKIPLDKDGNLSVSKDLMNDLHNVLKLAIPEHANGLTTPFEIKDVSFTNQTQAKEDLLSKAERGAFISGGWSSSGFADNGGHTGLSINIEIVTANIFAMLEKIEDVFSRKFKNIANSKNYVFKLKFFRTTNVNVDDNFNRMYKLLEIGGSITPLISLSGIDPEDYNTLLQVEAQLGIKDNLQVPQSMHTQTSGEASGQPTKQETKLTDSGATARDLETNKK